MATLNISLPDSMRTFVDQQVAQGGYSTASEYIRELVRAEQKRAAQQRLESLLLEGVESLESGRSTEISPEWWANKRAKLLESLERRKDS